MDMKQTLMLVQFIYSDCLCYLIQGTLIRRKRVLPRLYDADNSNNEKQSTNNNNNNNNNNLLFDWTSFYCILIYQILTIFKQVK